MQSFIPTLKPQTLKSWRIITPILALLLVLAVACGEAAAPTSPPPAAQATEAPQAATQPTEAPQAATQPTAVPEAMAEPEEAMVEVNPGKLTIMEGDWGKERFDKNYGQGAPGEINYARLLGAFLISGNERMEMVPGIASKWGFSADGLTWTFTIREGVKFHDGSDLTPEDVLWTLQHGFGPEALDIVSSGSSIRLSREMNRIELSGPDEVSVTTKKPFVDFDLTVSAAANGWFHIMPKRAKLHDSKVELAYDDNPIGAGPMSLVGHTRAQVMRFERFDDFYYQPKNGFPEDKGMKFQSADLFLVPEEATRVAALRAGEADIVPASLATRKQVEAEGGRMVFSQEGIVVEVRLLGCWKPEYPCSDKRVRQAWDYAIDKEVIQDQLYGGSEAFEAKGWWVVTPSTIGYTPALDPWPFDPDKARQLLADAGYPGGKGFGKMFVYTAPSSTLPFNVESAQLAADMWRRELGLDVEVVVGDRTGMSKRQYAGELDGHLFWRDQEARPDAISSARSGYGDPEHYNRRHENPELFRMVQETVGILDPDKRAEASKEMYLRLRDESYNLGIGYSNIPWGVGPRVLTWRPNPLSSWPSALHTITLK